MSLVFALLLFAEAKAQSMGQELGVDFQNWYSASISSLQEMPNAINLAQSDFSEVEDLFSEFDEDNNSAESKLNVPEPLPEESLGQPEKTETTQNSPVPREVEKPAQEPQESVPVQNNIVQPDSDQNPKPIAAKNESGLEAPDQSKEAEFHRIYKQYNRQPTSPETWSQVAIKQGAKTYKVLKGDTLWDISKTLFDDSYFWPKIWALNNTSILNPHEIEPGMEIYFYPGTTADAPRLALGQNQNEKRIKLERSDDFPAPHRVYPPLVKGLPSSLPLYKYGKVNIPKRTITVEDLTRNTVSPKMYLSYFVAERSVKTNGEILETEVGGNVASEFQYIFVHVENSEANVFHVVKELEPIKTSEGSVILVEVQGEIQIQEVVNAEDRIFRAKVSKSIAPILVGSKLIPGSMPQFDSSPGLAKDSITAEVIGGEFSERRDYFSLNSLVFINRGTNAGLLLNDSINVYANPLKRNQKARLIFSKRRVGEIKLVYLSDNYSVGYVSRINDDIRLGDIVGGLASENRNE